MTTSKLNRLLADVEFGRLGATLSAAAAEKLERRVQRLKDDMWRRADRRTKVLARQGLDG